MIIIIAVNYFSSDLAKKYLQSLKRQSFKDWQLYIIDNSNSPKEFKNLEKISNDPRVQIFNSRKNRGFFGGVDFFWKKQKIVPNKEDIIIVSNLDLDFISIDTLKNIDKLPYKHPGVGLFAPSIYSLKRTDYQNPMLIKKPSKLSMQLRKLLFFNKTLAQITIYLDIITAPLRKKFKINNKKNSEQEIYAAHGSFMIFSYIFFECGGNFKYKMFLFGEELYIAEQCKKLKLKILYVPSIEINHISNVTLGTHRNKKILEYHVKSAKHNYDMLFERNN